MVPMGFQADAISTPTLAPSMAPSVDADLVGSVSGSVRSGGQESRGRVGRSKSSFSLPLSGVLLLTLLAMICMLLPLLITKLNATEDMGKRKKTRKTKMEVDIMDKDFQAQAEPLFVDNAIPFPNTCTVAPLQHVFPRLVASPVYATSALVAPLPYAAPAEQTMTMRAGPQQTVAVSNVWSRC